MLTKYETYVRPAISEVQRLAVNKKLSCVRCQPLKYTSENNKTIATGSWDNLKNEICLRNIHIANKKNNHSKTNQMDDYEDEQDFKSHEEMDGKKLASIGHVGDVVDLQFINERLLASCSSLGYVNIYRVQHDIDMKRSDLQDIDQRNEGCLIDEVWSKKMHKGSATSLALQPHTGYGDLQIASSGEDGVINFFNLKEQRLNSVSVCHRIDETKSSISKIHFSGSSTILSCGMGSRFMKWDIRKGFQKPSIVCIDPFCHLLTTVRPRPSQPNIIATGSASGILSLWDIRFGEKPICSFQAHSNCCLWDVLFLPQQESCVVTCGEDGGIHLWDFDAEEKNQVRHETPGDEQNLHLEVLYKAGLSCNMLELYSGGVSAADTIVCPTDSQSLLYFEHLPS